MNRRHFIEGLRRGLGAQYTPEVFVVLLTVFCTMPLWVVFRPPIQDLPQHVAAVTVLSSYSDPALRFAEYFELSLGRTQYLTVYLLAALLAKVFGSVVATKLVLSLSLVATPYTLLRLLRALGLSPWLTLLSLPLVFNVHVAFGFLNFVAAVPLMFWGLELAVRERLETKRSRQVLLASVLCLGFLTHILPFGLLVVGVVLLTPVKRAVLLRQAFVLLPSLSIACLWLAKSPAGRVVAAMGLGGTTEDTPPSYQTFGDALRHIPEWMLDITTGDSDEARLTLWFILIVVLLVVATTVPAPFDASAQEARSERERWGRFVVGLIVPISIVAYVTLPTASGYIWPICQRFPLLAAYFVIPLLGRVRTWVVAVAGTIAVGLSVTASVETQALFLRSEATAYHGFEDVIRLVPKGSKVATLIFDRHVEGLRLSPLMHAAGWVQAARGGMVMFTFAEFPSSPFTYRETRRPPKVPPRWEWVPDRVKPDRDLPWYDYVLTYGGTGSLSSSRRFLQVSAQGRWSLWRRVDSSSSQSLAKLKF